MPTRALFSLALFTLGCGGGPPSTAMARAPRECSAQLEARTKPLASIPATRARNAALSQIVVHGEAPLAPLVELLESRIQRRLAEGRFGIGPAGRVSYSVERGALTLSVVGNQLVVQTPVHARAEACRGENCYASCEPDAVAVAQVPLFLRPDYGFDPASVTLRFTRGCKVRALGGFLTVDLTPTLEAQLEPELARVARQVDAQLRDVRAEVERGWQQLSRPRELPMGGCLLLQPQRVVQGPLTDSSTSVHARFAVLARPELRSTCNESPDASPLPALERDLSMPNEGKIMLGLVTPLRSLQGAFAGAREVALADRRVHVSESRVSAIGSDVVVALTLGGDLCGELAFAATPSFANDGAFIGLTQPRWLAGERERVAAQGFDADPLLRELAAVPQLPPTLSVMALQSGVPPLVKMQSTPELDLSARISSSRGAGAAARVDDLVAWVEVLGRLDVKVKATR